MHCNRNVIETFITYSQIFIDFLQLVVQLCSKQCSHIMIWMAGRSDVFRYSRLPENYQGPETPVCVCESTKKYADPKVLCISGVCVFLCVGTKEKSTKKYATVTHSHSKTCVLFQHGHILGFCIFFRRPLKLSL